MCRLKSAIVLKDKIFMPLDYDSHEQMISELKLDDSTKSPDFVRVEMVPKDDDIFNHNLDNWELWVDQDFLPEWFNKKLAEEEMKVEIKKFFVNRFIINDKTGQCRENQRLFIKNSSVVARDNSSVVARDNSSVVARDNSSVVAWGNSQILIYDDCHVKIKGVHDNATVKDVAHSRIIVANPKIKIEVFEPPKEIK